MKTFRDPAKLQKWALAARRRGSRIALVPTMGYLHEGHLSLVRRAKALKADEIVVSIFVNPVQFCPGEDFEKYPRDEKADIAKCKAAGATAVFVPAAADMYLDRHSTSISEKQLSAGLCGARRPGHFDGVCTVVAKLFNIAQPDIAVFGRKDYQQAQVVKRMVRDLNFPVKIVVSPIVREASGLAMSSRNTYLGAEERRMALAISAGLKRMKRDRAFTPARLRQSLERAGLRVDYVECVDAATLERVGRPRKGDCVLVAAYSGRTRLIDNIIL